jgi:hypothetical protein
VTVAGELSSSARSHPLLRWSLYASGYAIAAGIYFGDVFASVLGAFLGVALGAGVGVIAGIVADLEWHGESEDLAGAGVIGGMVLGIAVGVPFGVGAATSTVVTSGAVGLVLGAFRAAQTVRDVRKWRKGKDDRIAELAAVNDGNSGGCGVDD